MILRVLLTLNVMLIVYGHTELSGYEGIVDINSNHGIYNNNFVRMVGFIIIIFSHFNVYFIFYANTSFRRNRRRRQRKNIYMVTKLAKNNNNNNKNIYIVMLMKQ